MALLTYATPRTLRDFGMQVKDREDRGLGKRSSQHPSLRKDYGKNSTETPRTRSGKTQPGGRSLRRVLTRLEARGRDFDVSTSRQGYIPGSLTRPGSRKP